MDIIFFLAILKALRDEGLNPEEYLFDITVVKGKTAKPSTPLKNAKEGDKTSEKSDTPQEKDESNEPVIEKEKDTLVEEDELILKDECFEEVERIGADQEEEKTDIDGETSNVDNEDSINLTIGEEEEQLLRDEDDVKPKGNIQ